MLIGKKLHSQKGNEASRRNFFEKQFIELPCYHVFSKKEFKQGEVVSFFELYEVSRAILLEIVQTVRVFLPHQI